MDIQKAKLLIREHFAKMDRKDPEEKIVLSAKSSPDLFSNFTDHDVPTLKSLNGGSEFHVQTRKGEQNINNLAISEINPNQL